MLKTDNENARNVLRNNRRQNPIADHYISFIHKNFPNEEKNQYTIDELRKVAIILGINSIGMSKETLYNAIRSIENYQSALKNI